LKSHAEKTEYTFSLEIMAHDYDDSPDKWKQPKFNHISEEVKLTFEPHRTFVLLFFVV
jgi:hypothetical protein